MIERPPAPSVRPLADRVTVNMPTFARARRCNRSNDGANLTLCCKAIGFPHLNSLRPQPSRAMALRNADAARLCAAICHEPRAKPLVSSAGPSSRFHRVGTEAHPHIKSRQGRGYRWAVNSAKTRRTGGGPGALEAGVWRFGVTTGFRSSDRQLLRTEPNKHPSLVSCPRARKVDRPGQRGISRAASGYLGYRDNRDSHLTRLFRRIGAARWGPGQLVLPRLTAVDAICCINPESTPSAVLCSCFAQEKSPATASSAMRMTRYWLFPNCTTR